MPVGRPAKSLNNRDVMQRLKGCVTFSHALTEYPVLDDIFTGVSLLDFSGNARPLDRKVLFDLIRAIPDITTEAIKSRSSYSLGHIKKLAMACRIISNAFNAATINLPVRDIIEPEDYLDYISFRAQDRRDYYQFLLKHYPDYEI